MHLAFLDHSWCWVAADELLLSQSWHFLLKSKKILIILGDKLKDINIISPGESKLIENHLG